jgi:Transposase
VATGSTRLRLRSGGLLADAERGAVMEVLYPRCAGLDLAKDNLVACVRIHGRPVQQECRTFGMTTRELVALAAWLEEHGVTHVAMEATGTYWKAIWYLLEASFTLTLANAAHIRNVPGRKSDGQGRRVDRGSAGARADPRQFRSTRAAAGRPGSHAHAETTRA